MRLSANAEIEFTMHVVNSDAVVLTAYCKVDDKPRSYVLSISSGKGLITLSREEMQGLNDAIDKLIMLT